MKILSRLLSVLLGALTLDLASKVWVEARVDIHQPVPVIGDFLRLTLGHNSGVAFGMFDDGRLWPSIIISITGMVILFLFVWFAQGLRSGEFPAWTTWPIGLLMGGAIGNFVDRLLDGRVTDFVDIGIGATRWYTFNLADSFILIGVGLFLLHSLSTQFNDISPEGEAEILSN